MTHHKLSGAIMKAVLPAAGFGSRFLPVSKVVPKELLPLGNRPVIDHVVAEAVAAGCDDILVIISRAKESIRAYFEPAPWLETQLEERGKGAEADILRELYSRARFSFVYQDEIRGLGDAVFSARSFTADDPFVLLLADTVIHGVSPIPSMLGRYRASACGCVAVEPCPADRVSRYGIAGGRVEDNGVIRLNKMVEKPVPGEAPRIDGLSGQYHAFAARYLFTPAIHSALSKCPAGLNGEVQLTDAMREVMGMEGFEALLLEGTRLDIGSPSGLLEAMGLFVS